MKNPRITLRLIVMNFLEFAIWGAYLFGILFWMFLYIPGLTRSSQELFKMLPYAVTVIVLIITSLKNSRDKQPPAALGLPYFREER